MYEYGQQREMHCVVLVLRNEKCKEHFDLVFSCFCCYITHDIATLPCCLSLIVHWPSHTSQQPAS